MSERLDRMRRELEDLKRAIRVKECNLPEKVGLSLYGEWECSEEGRALLTEDALARAGYLSFEEVITADALLEPMALKWLTPPGGVTLGYFSHEEMRDLVEKAVEIMASGDYDHELAEELAADPDFPVLEFRPLARFADANDAISNGPINWPHSWRSAHTPAQLEECMGIKAGRPRGCVVVLRDQRIMNTQASSDQNQEDKAFPAFSNEGTEVQRPVNAPE